MSFSDDAPKGTFGDRKEMPLTGICNRLVVTSIHAVAQLPSPGLAPFDRRNLLHVPAPYACTASNMKPSTAAPSSRCRHPQPRIARRFGAASLAVIIAAPPRGLAEDRPESGRSLAPVFSTLREPD